MYPTFKFLIPVRSFSSFSRVKIKSLDPLLTFLNSSNSVLYPLLINPPSWIVNGASSEIDLSSKLYTSSSVSISLSYFNSSNIFLILGKWYRDDFNCNKSFAFKLP